jgi:hypothetical protein
MPDLASIELYKLAICRINMMRLRNTCSSPSALIQLNAITYFISFLYFSFVRRLVLNPIVLARIYLTTKSYCTFNTMYRRLSVWQCFFFLRIVFYSCRDASHAKICFMIHSHSSWPRSGDCGGSRIRTRDSCVLCLVSPSCFNQLSHHSHSWQC